MNNFQKLQKKDLLADLEKLVSFRTITGQTKDFSTAMKFIQSKINKKAKISRLTNNNTEIILASNSSTKTPDIIFLVHLDVVPGKDSQFTMTIDGDIVMGRGVSDMKFSIPLGCSLLNEIIESGTDISFMLAITSDEETGGFHGAKFLADNIEIRPKLAIVPDGGDNFACINKNKGVCQIKITSKGKSTHSSRVWLGKNALLPLIKVAQKLEKIYHINNKTEGWNTTMNIGELHGGTHVNQVCNEAHMSVDFRFPPEKDSAKSIITQVKKITQAIDKNLKVETIAIGDATYTNPENKYIKLFTSALNKHTGKKITIAGGYGSTDARHFNKYDIPIMMAKPSGGDIHGDSEWISISSTLEYYKALREFIKKL